MLRSVTSTTIPTSCTFEFAMRFFKSVPFFSVRFLETFRLTKKKTKK